MLLVVAIGATTTYRSDSEATAGAKPEFGLLQVTVPGLGKTRVSVQIGPVINGSALRDAPGEG
ncbi:DUF2291 family protein [Streptomyces sp. NPDC006872]|uniref:DUF2291 family protein n=1 Tax=Streptomyces sp. NPDC006872 TaxID=3155720 RepID=UPI00340A1F6D